MITVCKKDNCAGCKLCENICPTGAVTIDDSIRAYNAVIDEEKCINCDLCHKFCPQNNALELTTPIEWHQGWSLNLEIRANSSSGGLAAEISKSFIEHGGEVLTCRFKDGTFGFEFFDNVNKLSVAAGSKYVKSDPAGIYGPLLKKLRDDKQVLMIALPCQIAAAKAYAKNHENLYTVDLICHGTPSPKVLETFLAEKGVDLAKVKELFFRDKGQFGLRSGAVPLDKFGQDAYMYAFLQAILYTENCYHCPYAGFNRVSDVTVGDSWGSELSREEQAKGISLILCQTEKGKNLLEMAEIERKDVDIEKAVAANQQLQRKKRDFLMDRLGKGESFEKILFQIAPLRTAQNIARSVAKSILPGRSRGGVQDQCIDGSLNDRDRE